MVLHWSARQQHPPLALQIVQSLQTYLIFSTSARQARSPDAQCRCSLACKLRQGLPRLVCQGLVILEAVRLVTDEQVAGVVAPEALLMQPEGLVGEDEHLHSTSHSAMPHHRQVPGLVSSLFR